MRKKHVTTFPCLRTVYIGPQSITKKWSRNGRGGRPEDSIEEAIKRYSTKKLCIRKVSSRAEAVRNAKVVITIGQIKQSFKKPTLNLTGELSVLDHGDKIRRFLRDTKATSVAFALTANQPYWKVFKMIKFAFDWSKRDFAALTNKQKQEIRNKYTLGMTHRELAFIYGVSQPAITFIVRGYPDHKYFVQVRKEGFVTINELAVEIGVYWADVRKKIEDLKINIHNIGPKYKMINRKDAKRLRAALQRIVNNRKNKGK